MHKILNRIRFIGLWGGRTVLLMGGVFFAIIAFFGIWADGSTDWWAIIGTLPDRSLIYLESANPSVRQSAVFPFARYRFERPGFHVLRVSSWTNRQTISLLRNHKDLPILREITDRSTWSAFNVNGTYGTLRTALDQENHAAMERQLGQAYSAEESSQPLRFHSIALPGCCLFVLGGILALVIMARFARDLNRSITRIYRIRRGEDEMWESTTLSDACSLPAIVRRKQD